MNQKIQDLILKVKHDKKYQLLAAGLVVCVAYLAMSDGRPERKPRVKEAPKQDHAANNAEARDDLLKAFVSDLDTQKRTQKEIQEQLNTINSTMAADQQRVADIMKKMLDQLAETKSVAAGRGMGGGMVGSAGGAVDAGYITDGMGGSAGMVGTAATIGGMDANGGMVAGMPGVYGNGSIAGIDGALGAGEPDSMAQFGDMSQPVLAPPAPPAPQKIASIGPGDSVRIKLLAGVNAPTDGTPYPVVFKLVGDVAGPDGSALPLGEARLVAAAQGSLTDRRALFRLTTLNIRLPDGQKKVVNVDGWVVGEDGLRGMEGVMIDPIGQVIAGQAMAGAISGAGQAFGDSGVTTTSFWGQKESTVTDPLKLMGGRGIENAAGSMAKTIEQRAGLLVPHVQVFSGREATAVFSKSVNITDLYEALESGDQSIGGVPD